MKKSIAILLICCLAAGCQSPQKRQLSPLVKSMSAIVVDSDNTSYRDLNHNGKLDTYENPQAAIESRVADLMVQMTLAEKAGMMFINGVPVSEEGNPFNAGNGMASRMPTAPVSIEDLKMNHFNIWDILLIPESLRNGIIRYSFWLKKAAWAFL